MRIRGQGKNRVVYTHEVVDANIMNVKIHDERIKFTVNTKADPGIGTGRFTLFVSFTKSEIFTLYEKAINLENTEKLKSLDSEIKKLRAQLAKLG